MNIEDHINAVVATAGVIITTEFLVIIIEDHTMVTTEDHIIAVVEMAAVIITGTLPEWMKMDSP